MGHGVGDDDDDNERRRRRRKRLMTFSSFPFILFTEMYTGRETSITLTNKSKEVQETCEVDRADKAA